MRLVAVAEAPDGDDAGGLRRVCLDLASEALDVDVQGLRVVHVVAVAVVAEAGFGVEFAVARAIGSVSLFADSVDFLEDASVNLLIALALGWSATHRARLGMILAGILLIPGLATLWTAWEKFMAPLPPAPVALSLTGAGALAINLSCAFMLARFRAQSGSLTRAAWLSARNDALANIATLTLPVMATSSVAGCLPWALCLRSRPATRFVGGWIGCVILSLCLIPG